MDLANLIPAPVRDIVFGPSRIKQFKNTFLTEQLISAPIRITIAALSALAIYKFGLAVTTTAALTGVISFPALAIAAGCALLYQGVATVVASLASGSFVALGIGTACLVGGWLSLEYYNFYELGIGESFIIRPLSQEYAPRLLDQLKNSCLKTGDSSLV